MLEIIVDANELYDDMRSGFIIIPKTTLRLEHSLSAISKWESFYKKPFLSEHNKSFDETLYYIKCMAIDPVNDDVYHGINDESIKKVEAYIVDKQTATIFSKREKGQKERITSEEVYYWMISLNVPFECDRWNFSRLMTLIDVCNEKSKKPAKVSNKELYERNSKLNETRKNLLKTKG